MSDLPDAKPGEVSFYAARPSAKSDLAGVAIRIELAEPVKGAESEKDAAGTVTPSSAPVLELATNEKGLAYAKDLVAGTHYVAIATLYGVEVRSQPFTPLVDTPLSFAFAYEWKDLNAKYAIFRDVGYGAEKVYIAKVFSNGRSFYSLPFQLTKERGAVVGIYMYPELLFSVHGGAELDDAKMWFQSRFTIANPGIMPFRPSSSGMHIPLPKGFVGASVADEMTSRVGVESDKGFIWRGDVPPGQRDFIATYALNVEGGAIHFDMDLPYGIRSGRVVVEDLPGAELRTPPGAKVVSKTQPNGRGFLEMPEINIEPKQRLVFGLVGLPQTSAWQSRMRIGVGIVALLLIGWAIFAIFLGPKGTEIVDAELQALETNREKLMAQMVKLETDHRHTGRGASAKSGAEDSAEADRTYKKRRDKLNTKLTAIYREIDEHKSSAHTQN